MLIQYNLSIVMRLPKFYLRLVTCALLHGYTISRVSFCFLILYLFILLNICFWHIQFSLPFSSLYYHFWYKLAVFTFKVCKSKTFGRILNSRITNEYNIVNAIQKKITNKQDKVLLETTNCTLFQYQWSSSQTQKGNAAVQTQTDQQWCICQAQQGYH